VVCQLFSTTHFLLQLPALSGGARILPDGGSSDAETTLHTIFRLGGKGNIETTLHTIFRLGGKGNTETTLHTIFRLGARGILKQPCTQYSDWGQKEY